MLRRIALGALALSACAATMANPPPTPRAHSIEIVGNYHGRQLQLDINGGTVAQGMQHLLPTGIAWREQLPPNGPVTVTLTFAACGAPFSQTFTPGAEAPTLIIDGCDIRLVGVN
ncbi:hypothetical protein [Vitreimonas flagellata]|uniref:hypothetical protein n=1 Tax=Vitreimonas flagellata TaxID=2560861 RepID=UPI0010753B2E|nr:hypothetical protein [Vitreimonas flagellata]